MSSANSANEKPIAAFVGIDWADQKHDIVLCAATGNAQADHRSISSDPDALAEWALEMQGRFGSQGRILICLEQSRGALIYFLMGYECFDLYPINPKQLSSYRVAFRPSGAKDDPVDGKLLCQLICLWRATLFRGEWCQSILYRKRVCGHAVSWAADRNSAGSFNGSG